jgi:dihydropyrimidinase
LHFGKGEEREQFVAAFPKTHNHARAARGPLSLKGYPRKGAIAVGSDADITIIDPAIKKSLRMADLHVRDYSPWEGWQVEGWPTTVILRGKVMVANGQLLGSPSDGQLIARKIDPRVLRRPAF